jgi:putative endonuclease
MSTHRRSLGKWGEALAADYLIQHGYLIVERNVHTPYGEIDLIAMQPVSSDDFSEHQNHTSMLVFVEVKTRASLAYGYPEESVTIEKQEHLLAAAQHYLQQHPEYEGNWRMDVIAIWRSPKSEKIEIRHFENAFN